MFGTKNKLLKCKNHKMKRIIKRETPLLVGENPNDFSFETHVYDVNVINSYHRIEKILKDGNNLKPHLTKTNKKKEYLDNLKKGIEIYCRFRNINFDFYFKSKIGLSIPSAEDYYQSGLALSLICCDLFRIRSFLQYQQEYYDGADNFLDVVEFLVCDMIKNQSPISDENERLIEIMQWVEEEREYEQFDENSYNEREIDNDYRIACKATKGKIRSYFLKLTQKNEAGQQIMKEEEIKYLLCANFKGFTPEVEIKKITPNLNQANLRYFVYQFYLKYSKNSHEAEVYASFLKENFTQFENVEISGIKKAFSRSPKTYPAYLM